MDKKKRKPEKNHKGESRYRKGTNVKVKEQKRKEKGKIYRENNNRDKIVDYSEATRKGRRRRMHGKKSSHRQ
jgi:hypothetical protein